MLNRERPQPLLLSAPIPKYRAAEPSPEMVRTWITQEPDLRLRKIKELLVNHIDRVDFFRFYRSLLHTVDQFNQHNLDPYVVLWDMAPNKSKRWVWSLIQNRVKVQPKYTDYSLKVKDVIKNCTNVGITSFVVFDDASYSGTQLNEDIIHPILEAADEYDLTGVVNLTCCVPYVGIHVPQIIGKSYYTPRFTLNCKLISSKTMLSGPDVLTHNLESYYRFDCKRRFTDTPPGELCDHSGSLTVFDHKTADSTSVAWQVFKAIGVVQNQAFIREPYKNSSSPYLAAENHDFCSRYPSFAAMCLKST